MRKIITEDMIEQACIQAFTQNEQFNFIDANLKANKVLSSMNILETENDRTGRKVFEKSYYRIFLIKVYKI